ncbi:MAG: hypothetical protein HKL84_07460, partial [Acidimicrobiaceae bacterium]|nr:hypothetical protein [Acidimicrobiaceae bacterium]
MQNDEREHKTIDENPAETSFGTLDSSQSPDFPAPIELAIPDQSQISEPDSGDARETLKSKISFAAKTTALGILIGITIGGIGFIRNESSQGALATKLIHSDTCLGANTAPSGFCFSSPVTVSLPPANPISELLGSHGTATISAPKSQIGIFSDAALTLRLTGLSGASPTSNSSLKNTSAAKVAGTLSLAYSGLTRTLQSGSNNGASIYYVGNNEIGTKNQVLYQGQQISLVVVSKIELKN